MKFGMRKPSLKKSIAARTSVKRYVRHSLGLKAPRGYKAMRDVLCELKDYPAWQEYSKLVDLVFGTNEI